MDAVQKAASGHPGAPMGMADIAEVLWRTWLRHNPVNPSWFNRDRFVLSNGHGSMLLYAVLHLCGYDLGLDDLRKFRQLHSRTPGHPEYDLACGIETTTGPLGQGLANAVGMALAEKILAKRYNHPGLELIDHRTWVFAGDGCLMEGISHEAASLAGTLQLGKLILVYDDNGISIDGESHRWFTDDTAARFRAYRWHVIEDIDGHDSAMIDTALAEAVRTTDRPTLICARTTIGYGSPGKQGTAAAHGSPLGDAEIAATRKALDWNCEPFRIPPALYAEWDCRQRGAALEEQWRERWQAYRRKYPHDATELQRILDGKLPADIDEACAALQARLHAEAPDIASRQASKLCLDALAPLLPELIGGSADLSDSNKTLWSGCKPVSATHPEGNYLHYGVREFAMTAIANGVSLHGGLRPYTGTFLVFSDYARNAVRLAALMGLPQILIYSHDSIGLGEDGPTHQPIEHLASLRTIPGLSIWRPCDALETAVAWQAALKRQDGPTALVLSRQPLKAQQRSEETCGKISRGGYILAREQGPLKLILLASGSEVQLAVEAATQLARDGVGVRVVSMPSCDRFDAQDAVFREQVLPCATRCRLAVEAGHPGFWRRYVGLDGDVVGIERYGASAPADVLMKEYGFSVENVAAHCRALLAHHEKRHSCC